MSRNIKIKIPETVAPEIIYRFRNFGEDIYNALKDSCSVSIEEIDRATDNFIVRNIATKNIGDVTKIIKNQLKKHNLENTASIVRL